MTYTYDTDGNRQSIQYPSGTTFNYTYTNRNQVASIKPGLTGGAAIVSYTFDGNGNVTNRALDNGTSTAYTVDNVNRDTALVHNLLPSGTTKRFDYAYNSVNDITAVNRDGGTPSANGDGFSYDLTQQIIGFRQNGTVNADWTVSGGTANDMAFDGCGNRTNLNGAGSSYNNMNQPTGPGVTYDLNGNLLTYQGWTYSYDAQNRLRSATNATASSSTTVRFYYDGLNRQIARQITSNSVPMPPFEIDVPPGSVSLPSYAIFSVWDGDWAILEEYGSNNMLGQSYVQGLHGLVKTLPNNIYYYQDSLGSTSHVANSSGALLESYRYDMYGKPLFFNSTSQPLNSSAYVGNQ